MLFRSALSDKNSLEKIQGLAYMDKDRVIVNERRLPIKDIDSIPHPAYGLFPMNYYRLFRSPDSRNSDFGLPILSGRGYKYRCNFCYRMDKGFRPRSPEGIIEEIMYLIERYHITRISFLDELLMSSVPRIEEICQALIKANLNIKWGCM